MNREPANIDIFLSYEPSISQQVNELKEKLSHENLIIESRENKTFDQLTLTINNSKIFICFLTHNYIESNDFKSELQYAYDIGSIIILLLIEKNDMLEFNGLNLTYFKTIDCYQNPNKWFHDFYDEIKHSIHHHLINQIRPNKRNFKIWKVDNKEHYFKQFNENEWIETDGDIIKYKFTFIDFLPNEDRVILYANDRSFFISLDAFFAKWGNQRDSLDNTFLIGTWQSAANESQQDNQQSYTNSIDDKVFQQSDFLILDKESSNQISNSTTESNEPVNSFNKTKSEINMKEFNIDNALLNDFNPNFQTKSINIEQNKVNNYGQNNNDKYLSDPVDTFKTGVGIYFFKDGGLYRGEILNGKYYGKGEYQFKNGNRYDGQWRDDQMHGPGVFYYTDGSRYEGQFVNGKKNGKGNFYFSTGDIYIGDWKDDLKNGNGVIYHANGDRYEGQFVNDKKHGKGNLYYKDGRVETLNSIKGESQDAVLEKILINLDSLAKSQSSESVVGIKSLIK
jgi:hypothetical protein